MWKLVLTISLLCWTSEGSVTCKDENGGAVDWYILYKAPKTDSIKGVECLYIDSQGIRRAGKDINDPQGVLANTLKDLFSPAMKQNIGFISYNDQPPKGSVSQNFGHSKGVLLVDKSGTGIWLLHSTPNFPKARDGNSFWPESGQRNAQTFICVTFPYDQFKHIGKHLQYIRAFPFDHDITADFHRELQDVVNKVLVDPDDHFQELTSSNGFKFYSIAKKENGADGGDLYVTISQRIRDDVLVQTWGCQAGRASSFCEKDRFKVENINVITTALGQWKDTKDHSKWCVAKDSENYWTCVADVNRAPTQYSRRGGALCIENPDVKRIFLKFVSQTEDCNNRSLLDILDILNIRNFLNILNPDCIPPPHTD